MSRRLYVLLALLCVILLGCTKNGLKDQLLRGKEECQVISFNSPQTGYKTFYEKELNVLGNPNFIRARIAGLFGDTENYKLTIQYLSPLHARITGYYTTLFHWGAEDTVIAEPGGFGEEENIAWDAYFHPENHHLSSYIINRNQIVGNYDTLLKFAYVENKLIEVETYSRDRWWFKYDENGNIDSVGAGPNTWITIQYSKEGKGKLLNYEPFNRAIVAEFTLMDMLGWLPLKPNRQRTEFTSELWYEYSTYNSHIFDSEGNLLGWEGETRLGWEGNAQNVWACRTSKVNPIR